MFLKQWKLPFRRLPVPNTVSNTTFVRRLTVKPAPSVWPVTVKWLMRLFRRKAKKTTVRMQPKFCWRMLWLMMKMPKSAILSLMSCRRSISAALPPKPQSRLLFRKFAMPNVTNNLKNTKKKSVRLLTEPSNESSSAMLFSISAKRKPFCAAMKLFRGKNSKTATGFALMSLMFAARIKGRRFSFPVLVRNSWPSCLRRRFRKFMTAWLKLWALPVIRVQKRKLPLKPMI